MYIKNFSFPDFDEWNKNQYWYQKIGNSICKISQTGVTKEGHRPYIYHYTLHIDGLPDKRASFLVTDTIGLRKWYEQVTNEANQEWKNM